MQVKELKNLSIYGDFEGQRVEITKIDFINKTLSIRLNVYGKKISVSYKSNDPLGQKLVLKNFSNIEILDNTQN